MRLVLVSDHATVSGGASAVALASANLTPGDTDIYTVYTPNGTTAYVAAGSNN